MLTVLFLTLGGLFLAGLATDLLGRRTRLPRVSLLLLFGFVIGPSGLALLPPLGESWQTGITQVALVMVGFLLGESLTGKRLRAHGREVLVISLLVTLATAAVVFAGLWALSVSLPLAMLLAGIATATDPMATADVIRESRAQGRFCDSLRGVVAIDDVWGLLLFTLILIVADVVVGNGSAARVMANGGRELFGSVALGAGLGLPMAFLSGRLRRGEPTQAEALGFVFLCAGLAMWLELSLLLSAIVMGMTVANLARHHRYAFHEIEGIEWPFLILFFMLAGASLDLSLIGATAPVFLAYLLLRLLGRLAGAWAGGSLAGSTPFTRRWMGAALLPQAGVATGMALMAAENHPDLAELLIALVIGTTVVFEFVGPIATRWVVQASGEAAPRSGQGVPAQKPARTEP